jgi:hypothetical protein
MRHPVFPVRDAGRPVGRCHAPHPRVPGGRAAIGHWPAAPPASHHWLSRPHRFVPMPWLPLLDTQESPHRLTHGYKSRRFPLARAHRAPLRAIEGRCRACSPLRPEYPNFLNLNSSTRWSFHNRVLSCPTFSPPELGQRRPPAPLVTPSSELPTPVLPGAARALLAFP